MPYIKLSGTTHYYGNNKKVFSNWKDIPILHGTEWDNGRARENTETVIYSTNAEVIGRQPFLVICEGANFGIVPNSVDLSLKTY